MIDAFKEMLEMIKHAPEYTMWVLLGILFYKVFIAGSWMMVARLIVVKAHDYFKNPPVKIHKWELRDQMLGEDSVTALTVVLSRLKNRDLEIKNKPLDSSIFFSSRYISTSDIAYLSDALNARIAKEKEANNK